MKKTVIFVTLILALSVSLMLFINQKKEDKAPQNSVVKPALNITFIEPKAQEIPKTLDATGSIVAWQEAIINAEINGLKLVEIKVQVGDMVKKGQVLAIFSDESVLIDVAQSKASLMEAQANFTEAQLNAKRAQKVTDSGALSSQQISQYQTQEKITQAKMELAQAQLNAQLLRQRNTQVLASDDGVISSRSATLGMVATQGQELFRLIRQNRLEWQAELTASEITQIQLMMEVDVSVPDVATVKGKVRTLAPSLDKQHRNGLVYVDLPQATKNGIRAGMFAHGEFNLGSKKGITIPQDAVSLRDGFNYVFRLDEIKNNQAKVQQIKVKTGLRVNDWVEIVSGVESQDKLVSGGGAFLNDGDTVNVVTK